LQIPCKHDHNPSSLHTNSKPSADTDQDDTGKLVGSKASWIWRDMVNAVV
jgi:hypothetical protein